MTAEEYALRIVPEGCDGNHPQGGCLFERVTDVIYEAMRDARTPPEDYILVKRNMLLEIEWGATIQGREYLCPVCYQEKPPEGGIPEDWPLGWKMERGHKPECWLGIAIAEGE